MSAPLLEKENIFPSCHSGTLSSPQLEHPPASIVTAHWEGSREEAEKGGILDWKTVRSTKGETKVVREEKGSKGRGFLYDPVSNKPLQRDSSTAVNTFMELS